MTHTVESLMALHDEVVGRSKLTEEGEAEARSRFLAALTEALSFNPDWADFENGRECGRLEAAQPNIQNYPEKDISQTDQPINGREELLLREMRYIASISNGQVHRVAMATLEKLNASGEAQPVREPLTDEQIYSIAKSIDPMVSLRTGKMLFARAIERAHGIGGGE